MRKIWVLHEFGEIVWALLSLKFPRIGGLPMLEELTKAIAKILAIKALIELIGYTESYLNELQEREMREEEGEEMTGFLFPKVSFYRATYCFSNPYLRRKFLIKYFKLVRFPRPRTYPHRRRPFMRKIPPRPRINVKPVFILRGGAE